jgi:hypothetical protein
MAGQSYCTRSIRWPQHATAGLFFSGAIGRGPRSQSRSWSGYSNTVRPGSPSLAYAQANRVGSAFRPVRSADRANDRNQSLVVTTGNAGIARHDAKMQARGSRTRIALFAFRTRHARRPRIAFVTFRSHRPRLTGVAFIALGTLLHLAVPVVRYSQQTRQRDRTESARPSGTCQPPSKNKSKPATSIERSQD